MFRLPSWSNPSPLGLGFGARRLRLDRQVLCTWCGRLPVKLYGSRIFTTQGCGGDVRCAKRPNYHIGGLVEENNATHPRAMSSMRNAHPLRHVRSSWNHIGGRSSLMCWHCRNAKRTQRTHTPTAHKHEEFPRSVPSCARLFVCHVRFLRNVVSSEIFARTRWWF